MNVRLARDSAQAHLQDLSEIVTEDWEAMDSAKTSHYWVEAQILHTEMEATATAMHGSYRHSVRSVQQDVEQVMTGM